MTRPEAWLHHTATLAVGGTGLVYGWMRYALEPEDEFALVNHPLEPTLQHGHVLFAPLLVFAAGLIFKNHVWARLRSGFRPRRRSGLGLTALLFPMIVSGYLVQVAVAWRSAWIWLHGLTSCLWIGAYVVHQLSPRRPLGAGAPAGSAGSIPAGSTRAGSTPAGTIGERGWNEPSGESTDSSSRCA